MKRSGFVLLILWIALFGSCKRTESETTDTTTSSETMATAASAPDTAPMSDTSATSSVPPADLNFATIASMANLYEIEAGKLAEKNESRDPAEKNTIAAAYKEFAHTMVVQHGEIGDSYKPIAEAQQLPMPTVLANISPEANFKTLYDELAAAPAGARFDALYKQQMIATHTAAVSLFQTEATSGQDTQLKEFAAKWLPTVQHHLEMANNLPRPK